jgi:hypothetical protein
MFTGRQALGSIDDALQRARQQLAVAEQRIEQTSGLQLELERQELAQFRKLAQIRVGLLASGEIIEHLDQGEQATARILATRDQARRELDAEIAASQQRLAALEADRSERMQRVDAAEVLLEQREAETQRRLRDDPGYQQQLAKVQEADRIARHAEEKTALAEQDREEKGRPYLDDPLFSYLWRRGYGTSTYHASAPIRFLDDWVARLCRYGDARANYAMLTEIPLRLKEHSDNERRVAEEVLDQLEALELQAADADALPPLRDSLDQARTELAELDTGLESAQWDHQVLLRRQSEFAAGSDRYYEQAIQLLAEEIGKEDIATLHADARLTPTREDDHAVRKLRSLRLERDDLIADLAHQREILRGHRERSEELETLRLDFKRQRYDGQSSVFADDSLVSMMLSEFLRGVLSRDGLWREIQRQHRYRKTRPNPDFGSGGFGRGKVRWGGGSGWGGIGGGRGGGGLGGGGGFRTGGGF